MEALKVQRLNDYLYYISLLENNPERVNNLSLPFQYHFSKYKFNVNIRALVFDRNITNSFNNALFWEADHPFQLMTWRDLKIFNGQYLPEELYRTGRYYRIPTHPYCYSK